jgi:hypothetical protein
MFASARATSGDETSGTRQPGWSNASLCSLLAATADRHPTRLAFGDQPSRDTWSGRPRIAWTYANSNRIVERLAAFLAGLGLPAGAPVGICLPNGSEACVTILAVERAGYIPCMLPMGWSQDLLGRALESAQISAVICQSRVAEERPAESFCHLASRYFGVRFICSYGPQVPDGVIDLDRAILDTVAEPNLPEPTGYRGIVTFESHDGPVRPVFRPYQACLATAVAFLVPEKIKSGERILSLLPPDDHCGLTTGLVASLVTGATLEGHGLVDSVSLKAALGSEIPTHLVAPGWMEPLLAKADLPAGVASIVLVHEAPVRFKARGDLHNPVTDVLCFGETALLARARSDSGHLLLSLESNDGRDAEMSGLLRIKRDEDGSIHFSGPASEVYQFSKGAPVLPAQEPSWRSSGFKVDLFAGTVIGVR